MTDDRTQKNKETVWALWEALPGGAGAEALDAAVHEHIAWHGPHPLNQLPGAGALLESFWQPFMHAFPDARRRTDIFFGGEFRAQDWVCGTGYFTGTFAQDWLDIPATGAEAHLRFGEFCRMEAGKIAESYVLLDLLDLMRQAGFRVLPASQGAEGLVPPPRTQDGVLLAPQDEAETQKSFRLVYDMLFKGLNEFDTAKLESMGMTQYWHPQMHWYGPCGIGACRSLQEFEAFHQGPFLRAFPDRKATEQDALPAEGHYVGASGWPGVIATHTGEYLGHPPTDRKVNMRVMDFWRREGDVLVENWVLIDLIDIFLQFGVDLFEALRAQAAQQ